MALHWVDPHGVVVDEGTFLPGKELRLEARHVAAAPALFQVYQVYPSALRQVLHFVGVPDRRLGPVFAPVPTQDGYRSDQDWRLAEPRGYRKSACASTVIS